MKLKPLLKPKSMMSLRRMGFYIFSYFLILIIIALLTDFWRSLDYVIYRSVYLNNSEEIELREDISVIDLPYVSDNNNKFDLVDFRSRLVDLLDEIQKRTQDKDKPKAVILDIYFSYENVTDSVGLKSIKNAINSLKDEKVKVYAVYNMNVPKGASFTDHDQNQAKIIYEILTEQRLHSMIDEIWGVLSYKSALTLPTEMGDRLIPALPLTVANIENKEEANLNDSTTYILPIGNQKSIEDQTYKFVHKTGETERGQFSENIELYDQFLIIGSFEGDETKKIEGVTSQSGTQLLAWALNDQLKNNVLAKQPLDSLGILIGLVIFFSFFVTLLFAVIFKYVLKLQTKPHLIAILSFLIGIVILIAVGFAFLAMNTVIPLGLCVLGMITALFLIWHFSKKFLVMGILEGAEVYDVFISYSHENSDWVIKNIYNPLSEISKSDGSKLKIFFDKKSIGIGEAFTVKYMKAIADSKMFVPILSPDYYDKNHCRNEMDLGVRRHVEQLIKIFPIAFTYDCVPEHYNHINFVDISANSNFLEELKKELI